jgi:4'-phosphopantetheinyl transferase
VPHRALVWLLDTGTLADETLAGHADWLAASERERLSRFLRPSRRRQYVAGRVLARCVLAQALGVDARSIRLDEKHGAAPVLVEPSDGHAGFSISHSGRWVACAASASTRVGLDIEIIDAARDTNALAEQAFDDSRRDWLAARPDETRLRDFFHLWSSMEARFKLGTAAASEFFLSTPVLSVVLCCEQAVFEKPVLEVKERLP